jgi:ribosome biogenesis SPOUT family RNA methylase Rps3
LKRNKLVNEIHIIDKATINFDSINEIIIKRSADGLENKMFLKSLMMDYTEKQRLKAVISKL